MAKASNQRFKTVIAAVKKRQDKQLEETAARYGSCVQVRCALLPSPEVLETCSLGEDRTNTRKDYYEVLYWLKSQCDSEDFYKFFESIKENRTFGHLKKDQFDSALLLAFSDVFQPVKNTFHPESPETVFWYYTGHGLGIGPLLSWQEGTTSTPNGKYIAEPQLQNANVYHDVAKLTSYQSDAPSQLDSLPKVVQGGEMCLHGAGFCNLRGILIPWLCAVTSQSSNSSGAKKNKHLVVVADSCYSGKLARDLNTLQGQTGPWNENGCSVTLQAACSPDETTFGGYFTPTFLTLNKNSDKLVELKKGWKDLSLDKQDKYRMLPLPSPEIATTRKPENTDEPAVTMEIIEQNLKLILFPNAGFFKYCHSKIVDEEEQNTLTKFGLDRLMTRDFADKFLQGQKFDVIDYKLKTVADGRYKGSPMGLFLMKYPGNGELAICAHVHFAMNDTTRVGRNNLVHHKKSDTSTELLYYDEDTDGSQGKLEIATLYDRQGRVIYWSWSERKMDDHDKIAQAKKMVTACYHFVRNNPAREECSKCDPPVTPGQSPSADQADNQGWTEVTRKKKKTEKKLCRWCDPERWHMQKSFQLHFKETQRCAFNKHYLESIKKYNIPTA